MTPTPDNKTKIVATIGPASRRREVIEEMLLAGMTVARLNFSHGSFEGHEKTIALLRAASRSTGRRVAIMADLPGPKMRLGEIATGPVELSAGDPFTLTARDEIGCARRVSTTFAQLPQVVKPGDRLFLNDGLVQLLVQEVEGDDVACIVAVGGTISSRKGLNLPGIALGISAFTQRDRECLEFALSRGVDAVSQSFVECAADVEAVRDAARAAGRVPFIVAKIERAEAVDRYDEILAAADGIMVARGDLGVEVPVQEMAVIQKRLIAAANRAAKPVITATQMLESMTASRLPTRAEATDVANAILDGTDCVMLSGESAVGSFPVESVAMLARIAVSAEAHRESPAVRVARAAVLASEPGGCEAKAILFERAVELTRADAAIVPTLTGRTARVVSSVRTAVWIFAVSPHESTLNALCFSYGVFPLALGDLGIDCEPDSWNEIARSAVAANRLPFRKMLVASGPPDDSSDTRGNVNQRIEVIEL